MSLAQGKKEGNKEKVSLGALARVQYAVLMGPGVAMPSQIPSRPMNHTHCHTFPNHTEVSAGVKTFIIFFSRLEYVELIIESKV